MKWFFFPQETIDFPFMNQELSESKNYNSQELELLEKLSAESLSEEEFEIYSKFIFELDEKHPTFLTGLCRRLLISLAREKYKLKLLEQQINF